MPSQSEWQKFFDSRFSEGLLVTFVANQPETAAADESPQVLSPKVFVSGVDPEDDDAVSIVFIDADTDRQFFFDVETVEPQENDRLLLTLADAQSNKLIFSPRLTEEQKEIVKTRRKGMW